MTCPAETEARSVPKTMPLAETEAPKLAHPPRMPVESLVRVEVVMLPLNWAVLPSERWSPPVKRG